jgi:hypothetical protein
MGEIGDSDRKLLDGTKGNKNVTGGAQTENCETVKAKRLELLKQNWPHLFALERGERLKY